MYNLFLDFQGLKKVTDDMKTHKNPGLRDTKPIPAKEKKSVALSVTLQANDKTLSEKDLDQITRKCKGQVYEIYFLLNFLLDLEKCRKMTPQSLKSASKQLIF